MKAIFLILLLAAFFPCAYSQYTMVNFMQNPAYLDLESTGMMSPAFSSNRPLLRHAWGTGAVVLKSGKQIIGIPLQFDIQSNRLYFKKDSAFYGFANNVAAFKMRYQDKQGAVREAYFKSGYPNIRGKVTSFLYEVVNDGPNVHLLKQLRIQIDQQYVYGSAAIDHYTIIEDLCLYNVKTNMLLHIAPNKKSVEKALFGYREQVEKFAVDNNCSFHNEEEINQLVTSLNRVK